MIYVKNQVKSKSLQKIEPHTSYKACVFDVGDQELTICNCLFENCSFRTPIFLHKPHHCQFSYCNFVNLTINSICPQEKNANTIFFKDGYITTLALNNYFTDLQPNENLTFKSVHVRNLCIEASHFPQSIYDFPQLKNLQINSSKLCTNHFFTRRNHVTDIMPELQSLDLSNNHLHEFPEIIPHLTTLQTLNLGINSLYEISPQISKLYKLQEFSLYNNQIFELPSSIGSLYYLQNLNLRYNTLETLPQEIAKLNHLKFLDISENQIHELPSQIGKLNNLQTLYARENILTTLPETIQHCQELVYLDLYNNQITELPWQICQLQNLSSVNLEGNPISYLPHEITQLRNLQSLNLVNTNFDRQSIKYLRQQLPECDIFY